MIQKTFNQTIKQLDQNTFRMVASDESIDRDGDKILLDGIDTSNYERNNVILWGHDASKPPVGRGKLTKDYVNKRLLVDVEFVPKGIYEFADTVRKLVAEKFVNAMSIGFLGKSFDYIKETGGKLYKSVDLLEISFVPCPSNMNALALDKGLISPQQKKLLEKSIDIDLASIKLPKNSDINLETIKIPVDIKIKMKQEAEYAKDFDKIMGGINHVR